MCDMYIGYICRTFIWVFIRTGIIHLLYCVNLLRYLILYDIVAQIVQKYMAFECDIWYDICISHDGL